MLTKIILQNKRNETDKHINDSNPNEFKNQRRRETKRIENGKTKKIVDQRLIIKRKIGFIKHTTHAFQTNGSVYS